MENSRPDPRDASRTAGGAAPHQDRHGAGDTGPSERFDRAEPWPTPLESFQQRLGDVLRAVPVGDIERNVKALAAQVFGRLDLVTRDEYDDLLAVVDRLAERVAALERDRTAAAPDSTGPPARP